MEQVIEEIDANNSSQAMTRDEKPVLHNFTTSNEKD